MLNKLFVFVYNFFKTVFNSRDYTIINAGIEYKSPPRQSNFWRQEEQTWTSSEHDCYTNVTYKLDKLLPVHPEVKDTYLHVDYLYNGKTYEYVTSNLDFVWPPNQQMVTNFKLPIISVVLKDKNDVPVKNITKQIIKCMGPRKDFHGQNVPLKILTDWDDYEYFEFTDVLGIMKKYTKDTSCLDVL